MVLPDSHRIFVSCATRDSARVSSVFDYRAFTFSGCAFQHFLLTSLNHLIAVPQPQQELLLAVWPSSLSLAATDEITLLFSFPKGTKMFQFPSFASV
jgi:hypothetical protein